MEPDDIDEGSLGSEPAESEIFERLLDHLCVAGFDGYWKRLNGAWTRTLGWSAEELMSRPLIEFVHPDDREATLTARSWLKEGEPLLRLTNRYRHKDGTYRWFEWRSVSDVERRLVYAVARDVTPEHEARRELRELTESLEATLSSMADGVIATDGATTVVRMNPVAEKLTGWETAEAVGRPLGDVLRLTGGDTRATALEAIERTLQEGLASEGSEHTVLVARDGREVPIAFSRAPMRGPEGNVTGAVLVFRDMTAERQARETQEQLQQQLVFADRMASVGTLAAGVAHEINNPLAYVTANLDLIASELRQVDAGPIAGRAAEWVEMADDAREGAERIRKIVRGLKTFSRAEDERRSVMEVRPIVEVSIDLAFNEIRHRARLVKDYGATPPVEVDDARLGQVFINLLVNAAQVIPEGDADANEIRVATTTDAEGNAVVEVRDTGPGIAPDVIDRVFDPFFTTKPIGIGTGLGLAICHNLVTGMGGTIVAANRDGGGAVFRVTLPPATGRPTEVADPTGRPEPEAVPRRASVLVVDDEPSIGSILRRVLGRHDVTAVTSAVEALELVAAGAKFDVVLTDLMMPRMSGMELYEELERREPPLVERVVFMTGGAFTPAAHAFLERVPNECLAKPFSPAQVQATVERLASGSAKPVAP